MQLINKYKDKLMKCFILFFFILMFLFPSASYKGASSGLMLWFVNILPTLLPFIIISNLMISLNIAGKISRLLYPVIGRLFKVSPDGSYPILIGFLSGLPMGAKASADLVVAGKIDHKEGNFLLSMCNNASSIFIINYIAINQLKMPGLGISLFVLIYSSSVLSALLYRTYLNKRNKIYKKQNKLNEPALRLQSEYIYIKPSFDLVDKSIMNGFEIITKIGGYIILFSILAQIINEVGTNLKLLKAIVMGILEITTGINYICNIPMDSRIKIVLISLLTSFGGLSGLAQTKSVLEESRLSIKTYIKVKLLSTLITALLLMAYLLCFKV